MPRKRLLWQLYPSYLFITLAALLLVFLLATQSFRQVYHDMERSDLEARGRLVEEQVAALLGQGNLAQIDALAKHLGPKGSIRITVTTLSGEVLGDSEKNPDEMENHQLRPEIIAAVGGEVGSSVRHSHTLNVDMMYVAIPLRVDGSVAGILRTSRPMVEIARAFRSIYERLALGGLAIALLAAVVSLFVASRISRPLEDIKRGAERFAQGDLTHNLVPPTTYEIAALADTFNQMAADLADRIATIVRQRNELDAILSSMTEGVLAVDRHERLLTMNAAAAEMAGAEPDRSRECNFREIVQNPALQEFVEKALLREGPVEDLIVLRGEMTKRYLQGHGTVLNDAHGKAIGALVVLNDVTRLRRLEAMRREFVANVSHELRTPITAIKGFVETLREGAIQNPEEAEHFLDILARHTQRLQAIIDDLLALANLEQEKEQTRINLEPMAIEGVLMAAIQLCNAKAGEEAGTISLDCPEDLTARVSPALLEQAVVNLIDNARKYSDPGREVHIRAHRLSDAVAIEVRDEGWGIDRRHLPRLFERFYRVDKSRSRKMGGTGLGLAIVKHIAQAHGGSVTVESKLGEGSVFRILLPIHPNNTKA